MRRKLRGQAYKGLIYWLSASRSSCGLSKHQDMLFSQLISDIVTHRDTVQLQTGKCFFSVSQYFGPNLIRFHALHLNTSASQFACCGTSR